MTEIKLSAQQQKIIDYMEAHDGHITNREIMAKLQINGATARISELRKKGFPILDRTVISPNGTKYKEYYFREAEK